MAPDDTSTTSRPAARTAARTSTSAISRSTSNPPGSVVSDDEPTLTTTREAPAISGLTMPTVRSRAALRSSLAGARCDARAAVRSRVVLRALQLGQLLVGPALVGHLVRHAPG